MSTLLPILPPTPVENEGMTPAARCAEEEKNSDSAGKHEREKAKLH